MALLSPGVPPGPLDVTVSLVESTYDRVLHFSDGCSEVHSWALGNFETVRVDVGLLELVSGDPSRFCGCVVVNLSDEQLRHLEGAAALSVLEERLAVFDVSLPEPWLPLLRLGLAVERLAAQLLAAGDPFAAASRLDVMRARVEALRLEALAAHPWDDRLRSLVRSEVLTSDHGPVSSGTSRGLRAALQRLDSRSREVFSSGNFPRLHEQRHLWVGDVPAAEAAAGEALALGASALDPSAVGLPRLASALVESAVERSFRAASRLAEYVVVVHAWRDDVFADTPLAPVLAEALVRGERVSLPGGVLGLRLSGALGHLLWEANRRREGGYSFGNVHGSLTFFKSNGVVEDLSGWERTIEVALVLWRDAGGVVEAPSGDRPVPWPDRSKPEGPDPLDSWSAALAALA